MKCFLICIGLFVFALAVTSAAPVPKDAIKPVLYHPVTVGAKWVYLENDDNEDTVIVTDVEAEKDGERVVAVSRVADGKLKPYRKVRVSRAGLFRTEFLGEREEKPFCLLPMPHKIGQKWDTGSWSHEVFAVERVEVPAGVFTAIRVESKVPFPGQSPVPLTEWFAPEVGMVKEIYDATRMKRLKSFTPGKS